MELSNQEIRLFEKYRNETTKYGLKRLQKVYLRYNEGKSNCMCKESSRRKYKKLFYDWYDGITD